MRVKISQIKVGARIRKDLGDIGELAESISQYGLLCPIILRKTDNDDSYKLIAGHRRLRACRMLKKMTIDAVMAKNK